MENEKKNGFLIVIMSVLIVFIVAVSVAILGFYLEWFSIKKNVMEISDSQVTVEKDGSVTIKVENYSALNKPELTFNGYDEDLLEVESGRNGKIVITGLSEGETNITVSAKDCRNEIISVSVAHARPVTDLDLDGMAYSTDTQNYYFVSGKEYAVISDYYEDYARGGYTVERMNTANFAEIYSAHYDNLQKEMDKLIDEGTFYYVTLDGKDEYFGGSHYSGNEVFLIISVNNKKLAVYDSGWDELSVAEKADMLSTDEIDEYFDFDTSTVMAPSSTVSTASSSGDSTLVTGTVPLSNFGGFGARDVIKETWKLTGYGNSFIYKDSDGLLFLISKADFAADKKGERLSTAGGSVKFFAVNGDVLVYFTEDDELGIYNLGSGKSEIICDELEASDMTIIDDYIYLTDYASIWKISLDGSCDEIWDSGAWALDANGDFMYVYDGSAWDLLNIKENEYIGEFVSSLDEDYEADVIEVAGDYAFTVIYEYNTSNIYVRAININTGDNINITSGVNGEKMDTYSAAFICTYIYYTTGDGETLNRVDVTTGKNITLEYANTDIYYSSELMEIGGVLYGSGFDDDNEAVVFEINQDTLEIEDIFYLD